MGKVPLNLKIGHRKKPGLLELLNSEIKNDLAAQGIDTNESSKYYAYQGQPVAFCEAFFHQKFPPEVVELMESVESNRYTVAQSCNAFGKSFCAASFALYWLLCYPDSQVYLLAAPPITNLKNVLFGHIAQRITLHKSMFYEYDCRIASMNIIDTTDPRHFLTGVTIPSSGSDEEKEARVSGKHAGRLLFLLDEADAIPDPIYKGIDGCMTGGNARALLMFNPRNTTGYAYRLIRDNLAKVVELSAFNHPNVVTGQEIYPGAVDRESVIKRINLWTRPLNDSEDYTYDCFTVPKYLDGCTVDKNENELFEPLSAGQQRKIVNHEFSYKVLGKYPAANAQSLISREWIDKAIENWEEYTEKNGSKIPHFGVAGFDVAEYGSDKCVITCRYGNYISHPYHFSGMEPVEAARRCYRYLLDKNVDTVFVDSVGIGASLPKILQLLGMNALGVKVSWKVDESLPDHPEFVNLRCALYWEIRDFLSNNECPMLPPIPELVEELLALTYEYRNQKVWITGKKELRELLNRSPDHLDSLALTFYETVGSARIQQWQFD